MRGFTQYIIIPKYKCACIQYRQMYNYSGGFTTTCVADNFADATNHHFENCVMDIEQVDQKACEEDE
jgi:hypothetical protein